MIPRGGHGYQPTAPEIVDQTSFWVLIKEWFLNKRKIQLKHFVELEREETTNDSVKLFDWARENLVGRWHIRIHNTSSIMTNNFFIKAVIIAKFNREEDAMAFKLRWM